MKFLYELQPQFDGRKSFYRKANVYGDDNGNLFLMSYTTIVAKITDKLVMEDNEPNVEVYGYYSATTARHINEFLRQHNFKAMSKKEMEKGGAN